MIKRYFFIFDINKHRSVSDRNGDVPTCMNETFHSSKGMEYNSQTFAVSWNCPIIFSHHFGISMCTCMTWCSTEFLLSYLRTGSSIHWYWATLSVSSKLSNLRYYSCTLPFKYPFPRLVWPSNLLSSLQSQNVFIKRFPEVVIYFTKICMNEWMLKLHIIKTRFCIDMKISNDEVSNAKSSVGQHGSLTKAKVRSENAMEEYKHPLQTGHTRRESLVDIRYTGLPVVKVRSNKWYETKLSSHGPV
jgi:hypothetical protein